MTFDLKLIKETHKEAFEEYTEGYLDDNCYFSTFHENGGFTHLMGKVCYGAVYNYFTTEESEDEDCNWAGYDGQFSRMRAIIVTPYGEHMRPSDKNWQEYLKAVAKWFELFEPILVPDSFEERMGYGVVVDCEKASLNHIGAFLVGLRNLHEQSHYLQFNAFVDAGIPLHKAAFFTQLFYHSRIGGKPYLSSGNLHHNTLNDPRWTTYSVADIKKLADTCILYDQKEMVDDSGAKSLMNWDIGRNLFLYDSENHAIENIKGVFDALPNNHKYKDTWSPTVTYYWNIEDIVSVLKD